ncbi:hypothetical protein C3L33_18023, partial [Rhododendron williamsianum]
MVTVEFDSYPNPEWDPAHEHIGINNNSIGSVITTPWNASLHSGETCTASITYNASTKNLSVFWSYGGNSEGSLSYKIDLTEILPEWVMVGFSAATGKYLEKHTLESWAFSSSFSKKTARGKHTNDIKLIVALTVSMGVLIFGAGIFIGSVIVRKRRRVRRKKTEKTNLTSINDDLERGAGPRRFSYADLVSATSNFSAERKLGEGGFGCVYRGNALTSAHKLKSIPARIEVSLTRVESIIRGHVFKRSFKGHVSQRSGSPKHRSPSLTRAKHRSPSLPQHSWLR